MVSHMMTIRQRPSTKLIHAACQLDREPMGVQHGWEGYPFLRTLQCVPCAPIRNVQMVDVAPGGRKLP